ncbi:putative membrane protein [Escherichia coli 180200]|nr:putative membrane protein [Escherichia coli 180200]
MVNKNNGEEVIFLNLYCFIAYGYSVCINCLGKYALACYH